MPRWGASSPPGPAIRSELLIWPVSDAMSPCASGLRLSGVAGDRCLDSTSHKAFRTTAGVRHSQFTFARSRLESAQGRAKLNSECLTPAARQGLPRPSRWTSLLMPISGVLKVRPCRARTVGEPGRQRPCNSHTQAPDERSAGCQPYAVLPEMRPTPRQSTKQPREFSGRWNASVPEKLPAQGAGPVSRI